MPIFTNPVTLTDGTDSHAFSFRAQKFDSKSTIGEWVEPAASYVADSSITIKHDERSTYARRLVQRKIQLALPDATYAPLTINMTVTHNPLHASTDIQKNLNILIDAMQETGFLNNLLQGLI